jgi:hypothetical protein
MALRELTIDIDKDYEWDILLKFLDTQIQNYNIIPNYEVIANTKTLFADARKDKDGNIVYLLDNFVSDKNLTLAKKESRFLEVCSFTDLENNTNFVGTFVDALEYIKKQMQTYRDKRYKR